MRLLLHFNLPLNTRFAYLNESAEGEPEDPKAKAKFVLQTYTLLSIFTENEHNQISKFIDDVNMDAETGPKGLEEARPESIVVNFLCQNYEASFMKKFVEQVRQQWILHAEYPEYEDISDTFAGSFYWQVHCEWHPKGS